MLFFIPRKGSNVAKVAEVIVRIKGDDQLSGPLSKIADQFRSMNGLFGGFGKGLGGVTGTLMNVANSLYIAETAVKAVNFAFDATVGTVRLLTDEISRSVQASSEFEYAMAQVTSRTDAFNNAQLSDELQKTAIQLAQMSKFNPTEVVEGMRIFAMAGLETEDILKAMPEAVKLAAASNTDLAMSTGILTSMVSSLGLSYSELGNISDQLTAATLGANVEMRDIREGFKFLGPQAKVFGMGVEQSAAALAVLNEQGSRGGMAGRGMRSMFTSLLDPSKKALGVLQELGITLDDGTGNFKDFTTILNDFNRALAPLTEVEREEALAKIFTTEGGTAMNKLLSGMGKYNELMGEIQNSTGLSQRIMDAMLNTLQGRWEQLQETIYGLRIQIGDKFNPVLKEMVVAFQDFLVKNTDKIVQFFTVFADLLRETWGFAQKVAEAFQKGGIDAGFRELRKGLGSFATQLEKIGRDWKNWWAKIQSSTQFQELKKDIIKGLSDIGTAIFGKLRQWGTKFWEWVDKQIAPQTPGVFASLGRVILDAIKSFIGKVVQELKNLAQGFWDWVLGVKSQAGNKIGGLMQSIADAITSNWEIVLAVLGKLLFGWWGFFIGLLLPGVGPNLGQLVSRIAEYFRQNWPQIQATLTEWGTQFWNWLTLDVIPAAQAEIDQLVGEISRIIGEAWPVIESEITKWSNSFWSWLDTAINEAPTRVTELVQAIGDALSGNVLDANVVFGAWLTEFWRNLIPATFDISADMVRFTDAVTEWATSEDTSKAFYQVGEGLGKNIVVGLNSLMMSGGALEAIGSALASSLLMSGQNIKETVWSIGAAIAAGMMMGFIEAITGKEFSDEAANEIVWRFQEMAKSVLEAMAPVPVLILEGVEALIKLIDKLDELQRKIAEVGFGSIFGEDYDQKLAQGFDNLIDTLGLEDGLTKLKNGFDSLDLPWWLTPGSPTPLETGLRGINQALTDMPPIAEAFPVAATEQANGLHQAVLNIGQTLMNTVGPALDQIITKARTLWQLFNQLRSITLQWTGALGTLTKAINSVNAAMMRLNATMEKFSTPDTLTPGSPTPFEMGLRGIADAITGMPDLALGGAPMAASTGGVVNYYITVGGVSAVSTSPGGGDSADEAIQMTVNVLRQALGRA